MGIKMYFKFRARVHEKPRTGNPNRDFDRIRRYPEHLTYTLAFSDKLV